MQENLTKQQKETFLFSQLVFSLHTSAMHNLGKLVDPETGSPGVDLEHAKFAIDTLDMLRSKCSGNLTNDESRFLDQLVSDLKLNYVDELARKTTIPKTDEPTVN